MKFLYRQKQKQDCPVFQYVQHLKIDRAKGMLVTSSASITEIAFELGFYSSQYFCRIFKKITGLTPSGYKELILKKA